MALTRLSSFFGRSCNVSCRKRARCESVTPEWVALVKEAAENAPQSPKVRTPIRVMPTPLRSRVNSRGGANSPLEDGPPRKRARVEQSALRQVAQQEIIDIDINSALSQDLVQAVKEALYQVPGLVMPGQMQLRRLNKAGPEGGLQNLGIYELSGTVSHEELVVKVVRGGRAPDTDAESFVQVAKRFPELLKWKNVVMPSYIVRMQQHSVDLLIMPKLPSTAISFRQVMHGLGSKAGDTLESVFEELGMFLYKLHNEVCPGRQHGDFNIDNVYYDRTRRTGDKVISIDNCELSDPMPTTSDARFIYQESVAEVPHLKAQILKSATKSTRCNCRGCKLMLDWVCEEAMQ